MRVKMSKTPPPAPTASAIGPCPTVIQIVVGQEGLKSADIMYLSFLCVITNQGKYYSWEVFGWLVVLGLTAL